MFHILAAPEDQAIAAALQAAVSASPSRRVGPATSLLVCTPALNRAEALAPLMDQALEAWARNALITVGVDGHPAPLGFRDRTTVTWPIDASAAERQEFVTQLKAIVAPAIVAEPKRQTTSDSPREPPRARRSVGAMMVGILLFAALAGSILWFGVIGSGPGASLPQVADPSSEFQEKLVVLANRVAADLRRIDPDRSRAIGAALDRLEAARFPKPALLLPKDAPPPTHDAEWEALETAVTEALAAHPELVVALQADGALYGLGGSGIAGDHPASTRPQSWIVFIALAAACVLGVGIIVFTMRRGRNQAADAVPLAASRASDTPAQVFASYARIDARKVDTIVGALQGGGIDVWIDRERLPGGGLWPAEIVRAIRDSQALAVFCSRHAFASDNVFREVHLAASFRKALIPIALDPTPMPDTFLYYLSAHQSVSAAQAAAVHDAVAKTLAGQAPS